MIIISNKSTPKILQGLRIARGLCAAPALAKATDSEKISTRTSSDQTTAAKDCKGAILHLSQM